MHGRARRAGQPQKLWTRPHYWQVVLFICITICRDISIRTIHMDLEGRAQDLLSRVELVGWVSYQWLAIMFQYEHAACTTSFLFPRPASARVPGVRREGHQTTYLQYKNNRCTSGAVAGVTKACITICIDPADSDVRLAPQAPEPS